MPKQPSLTAVRTAYLNSVRDQYQDDAGDAVDTVLSLIANGMNAKPVNQMDLAELTTMLKDEDNLCTCTKPIPSEGTCDSCGGTLTLQDFVDLWN